MHTYQNRNILWYIIVVHVIDSLIWIPRPSVQTSSSDQPIQFARLNAPSTTTSLPRWRCEVLSKLFWAWKWSTRLQNDMYSLSTLLSRSWSIEFLPRPSSNRSLTVIAVRLLTRQMRPQPSQTGKNQQQLADALLSQGCNCLWKEALRKKQKKKVVKAKAMIWRWVFTRNPEVVV